MGRSRKGWNVRKTAKRRTSVRLEPELWEALNELARREGKSVDDVTIGLYSGNDRDDFTSAIRVHIVQYFRRAAESAAAPSALAGEELRP